MFEEGLYIPIMRLADANGVNETLRKRLSLTFPLLSDPALTAIRAYGVEDVGNDISLPATIVVKQGTPELG